MNNDAMVVTYNSRVRNRTWSVVFDLGSEHDNADEALKYAWQHNATITSAYGQRFDQEA